MPAVKISALFEQTQNWKNIAAHFYNYKVCGELPAIFGRDEQLDLSDMCHIIWRALQKHKLVGLKSAASTTAQP
ncbi:hypothetical protein GKKCFE_05725 [Pseudomonas sp. E141]|uniref:hypothetical protein n=1 Tax=Pseudomonas sp. E141 TaxID=2875961 RepID=UPI0040467979